MERAGIEPLDEAASNPAVRRRADVGDGVFQSRDSSKAV
jgi:hypothetical protein